MLVVMTVRTVLKVPFEKADPPLPFRRSGTPDGLNRSVMKKKLPDPLQVLLPLSFTSHKS